MKRRCSRRDNDIELKRNRGEVSCAECRRLKIKCDKQIPCQSCQRRGCVSLCPNGSLATGQNTRFILAATEHLHRRISKLSTRIRQLEDALAQLQAQHSTEPHPLLHDDLLVNDDPDDDATAMLEDAIRSNTPPQKEVIDAFGTLSIADHGISRFFGPTGGSESLLLANLDSPGCPPTPDSLRQPEYPTALGELALFSQSFPFTPMGHPANVQDLIRSYLPPWTRALSLCETYFEQVSWIFRGVTRLQLMQDMLPVIYQRQSTPLPNEDYNSPHDLALLFIIFAIGALVQPEPSNAQAEHFQQLSRAALALQPVLEKPSIVTIQTLHLMSIYNAMSGSDLKSETSMEMTWSLITLASHLSQTIGLHRDSARWGLSPKMVQRRRILFWDLFVADVWQSLNTGRPPSFSLAYIDCSFPQYDKSEQSKGFGPAFEMWQFRFAAECVAEVTSRTLTAEAPSYATIMELDRKVREFPLPEGLSNAPKNDFGASFQRCVLEHIRETVLMYIHRSFFAQAIIDQPVNPLKSVYAPSFLASYRAASTILRSIREQFTLFPNSCSRFWTMWTFAFTAAVIFGTVVTRGPRSPLAQPAMAELEQACILFTKASKYSIRALKALPILTRLSDKARYALANVKASSVGNDWNIKEEADDELTIFAGHTRFVSAKKSTPDQPVLGRSTNEQPSEGMGSHRPHVHSHNPSSAEVPLPRLAPSATWSHNSQLHSSYNTTSPDRTVQQRLRVDSISPVSSSSSTHEHTWSSEPVVLHHPSTAPLPPQARIQSPAPQVQIPSQPDGQYHHLHHRISAEQMNGGRIELHPPYYPHQRSPPLTQGTIPSQPGRSYDYPLLPPPSSLVPLPTMAASPLSYAAAAAAHLHPGTSDDARHSHNHPHAYTTRTHTDVHVDHHPVQNIPHHHHGTAELADLGLASRDSRLDERWSSFMADSGLLDFRS